MASRGGGRGGRGGRGRGGPQQGMPGPQKDEDGTLLPPPDGPPPLFPEMDLPEHPQLTAKDRLLLAKRSELVLSGKSSLFYLDKSTDVGANGTSGIGGPEKYGERESKRPKKTRQPLSAVMTMSADYFPAELMTTFDKRVSSSAAGKSQTAFWKAQAAKHDAGGLKRLEQLAKAETADAEGGVEKKDDEEAPVEDEALLDVDEEEDMENDDYYQGEQFDDDDGYDNDDGDGGGGDDGPVY